MNKKMGVVLGVLAVLVSMNGYAQKKQIIQQLEALAGSVPGRISNMVPVSSRVISVIDSRLAVAQVMMADTKYMSSDQLFHSVKDSPMLASVPAPELNLLETKFAQLDAEVLEHQASYNSALVSLSADLSPQTLANTQVNAMLGILNIQQYMQANQGEFPQLFTWLGGSWETAKGLDTPEGNAAFYNMLNILIKEQAGQVDPVVVERLVLLRQQASNPPSIEAVVKSLKEWREAFPGEGDPKLPTDIDNVNLWHNAPKLWLVTEIRLLQLTPNIELPEVLRTANVIAQ